MEQRKIKETKVVWVLDSGSSRHVTGNMALLSKFEKKAGLLVTFRDDNIVITKGYNNLKIENVIIKDIFLVEGLRHNL